MDKGTFGHDAVWISWENHRRSRELAGALGVPFEHKESSMRRIFRYPVLLAWTIGVVVRRRARMVFCQNPSIVLTTALALMSTPFRFQLVVDRHSNFKFRTRKSRSLKWRIFHFLSAYTLRKAEVTIVTTRKLMKWVHLNGGRAVVLHDKIPDLSTRTVVDLKGCPSVLFVCTYSWDEPIEEVLQAVNSFPVNSVLYITGRGTAAIHARVAEMNLQMRERRVVLTGFLPEDQYRAYMASADIVLVLTTVEDVLLCGAYEAVSLGKPLVLSGTNAIRGLFNQGVIYCENHAASISGAVTNAHLHENEIREQIVTLRKYLDELWMERFSLLLDRVKKVDAVV